MCANCGIYDHASLLGQHDTFFAPHIQKVICVIGMLCIDANTTWYRKIVFYFLNIHCINNLIL